eukprot:5525477-Pyramimonas_sp.AAC.1
MDVETLLLGTAQHVELLERRCIHAGPPPLARSDPDEVAYSIWRNLCQGDGRLQSLENVSVGAPSH